MDATWPQNAWDACRAGPLAGDGGPGEPAEHLGIAVTHCEVEGRPVLAQARFLGSSRNLFAITTMPAAMVAASIVFGTTLGNITALSPIIVRREFGAEWVGAV